MRAPYAIADSSRRQLLLGFGFSALLHAVVLSLYIWQPRTEGPEPSATSPVSAYLVMPVSSPAPAPDIDPGPDSPETIASPPQDRPPPEKHVPAPLDIPLVEQATPLPIERERRVDSAEPVREQPEEEPPEEHPPSPDISVATAAGARPSRETDRLSEQLSTLDQGIQSRQTAEAELLWRQQLHIHLQQHKRYPREARRLRRQGAPRVAFTLDRQGNVLSVQLMESCGVSSLDTEALALVRRAAPLPRPPVEIDERKLEVSVPIVFSM